MAICGTTMALANAGLPDNRPHTSNDPDALRMFCPDYRDQEYSVDKPAVTYGNHIAASGLAPVDFACHIFRYVGAMSLTTLNVWYNLHTLSEPKYFHEFIQSLPESPVS